MRKLPSRISVICLLCIVHFLPAQRFQLEAGLIGGAITYRGDVVEPDIFTFKPTGPAYGIFLRHPFTPRLGIRGNILLGKISGDDRHYQEPEWRQQRAFSFTSPITEVSVLGEWNFLEKKNFWLNSSYNIRVSPYIYGGVGGVIYEPKTDFDNNQLESLNDRIDADKNDGSPNGRITVPLGLGIKVNLSDRMALALEGGIRPGFTDYLDGISHSGDPNNNDWYGTAGMTVSYRFMEKDTDKDGIADSSDRCPEEIGSKKNRGCPDTDEDGVIDLVDRCPYLPGKSRMKGCPDTDEDGVADLDDQCPHLAGIKQNGGCPYVDSDLDGIVDKDDLCPDNPGLTVLKGCPDMDSDGITDADDHCPEQAGPRNNDGCPTLVSHRPREVELATRFVYFDINEIVLESNARAMLDQIADSMRKNPNYRLHMGGHTDNTGMISSNYLLSYNRARVCYEYLVSVGIDPTRMDFLGLGPNNPITSNETAEGRQLNRRTEFHFYQFEQN